MTEEEQRLEAEKKAAEETAKKKAEERLNELKTKSVEELVGMVVETSAEARDRRLKERELENQLKELNDAQKKAEEDKLKEDGKLNELIKAKEQELSKLQTEMEGHKTKAEEFEQFKSARVEDAKSKLGDKWNDEYSNLSLSALDKLVAQMIKSESVNMDTGSNGDTVKIKLTDAQKKDAIEKYPYVSEEKAYEFHKHNLITTGKIKTE